ncbi:MAG: D-hexose-6-phosphate mutarotase [Luteolibacter sp.]
MNSLKSHEIPGRVTIFETTGGLPAIEVETECSLAEVCLHGAQVTRFRKKGGEPLLFLSEASHFESGKAIRGGVPVVFPWFGPRAGQPAHGTARLTRWDLIESFVLPDGAVRLTFHFPEPGAPDVRFVITVAATLTMELIVTNTLTGNFTFENCLHTYFQIGDIRRVEVTGLQGAAYIGCFSPEQTVQTENAIRFTGETDRFYQNSTATVEIRDPDLHRTIVVRKSGSLSTIVWNPWIETARVMADLGDDEYLQMVCVESGNVKQHALTLAPGGRSVLKVEIENIPLGT